jgi:hypothetical protein
MCLNGSIQSNNHFAHTTSTYVPCSLCTHLEYNDMAHNNQYPKEFLPDRPLPSNSIHNVYKLKTQPKLVRYYHMVEGFPTKQSWLKATKNKQYPSWPGLTWEVANKHFPESKETLKGHGCKTRSKLRSMKMPAANNDDDNENAKATHLPCPTIKQKEVIIKTYNLGDKAKHLMYTNQTGRFPKKSSQGHQCIMVLIEIDSNGILVEAMKNRTASIFSICGLPLQHRSYSKNAHTRQ